MNVYLSFDIEVWCGSWDDLDGRFPASFERYVYGRSPKGDYALPKTLEILAKNGLKGCSSSSHCLLRALESTSWRPSWS
jgi:hypothetical protein